jgi:hypothetical protein
LLRLQDTNQRTINRKSLQMTEGIIGMMGLGFARDWCWKHPAKFRQVFSLGHNFERDMRPVPLAPLPEQSSSLERLQCNDYETYQFALT